MAPSLVLRNTYPDLHKSVSRRQLCIAGLLITVYGLEELRKDVENVVCLWLLHPRLADQDSMEQMAFSCVTCWNEHLQNAQGSENLPGLIAVSLDSRNHGSREIDPLANQDWLTGNEKHALDMFAIYHGTAVDTSQILTYLPSYLFPKAEHSLVDNVVCGVSLGGHAAWHCLMSDSRISTAVIVVGCPDYITLISERAERCNRITAGPSFLGSEDFPEHLLEAVRSYDPAGQLVGIDSRRGERLNREPISDERANITPIMYSSFQGKRVLNLAGDRDKSVPYSASEPFLGWLKRAIEPGGLFSDGDFQIEDKVFQGIGHLMSPEMAKCMENFLVETLQNTSRLVDQRPRL